MATIWDETKKQTAKMKGRPIKEVAGYIWEYYKIHIGLTVLGLGILIAIIHAVATSKDCGLGMVFINSVSPDYSTDYTDWENDLTSLLDLDTKNYEVTIDDTMTIGLSSDTANQEYASQQKLAAQMSSQSIDVLVANSQAFEHYAQLDYMYDLRDIMPEDMYEQFESEGLIYYTDAATYSDYDDDSIDDPDSLQASYTVDHTDSASMEQPVPVGIIVTGCDKLAEKGTYVYLSAEDDFQGQAQEAVLGVPINSPRTDAAIKAIGYLTGIQ